MSKKPETRPWPVQDVRYVEVALSEVSTRHLHVEFADGIRVVVTQESQLPLAAKLIEFLRREANRARKEGRV